MKQGHSFILAILVLLPNLLCAEARISTTVGDQPLTWIWTGKAKLGETFYGKNISLLNNNNTEDQIFYMRHTVDMGLNVLYGLTALENVFVELMFTVRNKGVWGNADSIAMTDDVEFKILDSVGQSHRHFIPRHLIWVREAWLKTDVGEMINLSALQGHTLTVGAFSFVLGRGIALGDAYAVSPDYLGFFNDSAVDQYAFGLQLSGDLIENKLGYDLYGAFLNNLASSLSQTGERVQAQIIGKRLNPVRGFAKVNYLFAGRLFWTMLKDKDTLLTCEPYMLYNNDPEQQVEVLADAYSKLATFGVAVECVNENVEWGFDTAINMGKQWIKGIDRNVIAQQNRNGRMVFVNSHVLVNVDPTDPNAPKDLEPYKAPQSVITIDQASMVTSAGKQVQNIVNSSEQAESWNGKQIGHVNGYAAAVGAPSAINGQNDNLFNTLDRFRAPYSNKLTGWMWVMDAAVYFAERDMKVAVTAAMTSGDSDPNFGERDKEYNGFIPLQCVYAGKRVRSSFILGSAGKLRRPLTEPEEQDPNETDDFAALTSDFTNLVFVGGGWTWAPKECKRKWSLNPNLLLYWLQHPDKAFDLKTKTFLRKDASPFLGTELNLFYDIEFIKNFKFFMVGSLFVPGSYYDDIRGKPLNRSQERILDRVDPTGFNGEVVPGIGTDCSYTFNVGLEIKF